MSSATKAALDTALAAHIADMGDGHILTGYALIACGFNSDNLERQSYDYFTEYGDGQAYHVTLGFALMLPDEIRNGWDTDPDE